MANILQRLRIAQDRTETLSDLIQDTLYLAEQTSLPSSTTADLKRAVDASQSIFCILGAVATSIERRHTDLRPTDATAPLLKGA